MPNEQFSFDCPAAVSDTMPTAFVGRVEALAVDLHVGVVVAVGHRNAVGGKGEVHGSRALVADVKLPCPGFGDLAGHSVDLRIASEAGGRAVAARYQEI
jgi:hypothetical protein